MTPNPQYDNNPSFGSIEELKEFLDANPDGVEVVESPQNSDE